MTYIDGREVVVKALVGSHNYNLNTSSSDMDWKYFVFPTFEDLYKGKHFSAAKQTEEMDYDVHDVRRLSELIWKANINFIEVLFSEQQSYHEGLNFLFGDAERWAGMNIPAFRNATYGMHKQKMGNLHKGTAKTMGLIDRFGYDTKEACHALRCLYTLEKYGDTNSMGKALWFREGKKRDTLLQVKAGWFKESEFLDIVEHWHIHVWGELSKSYNDTRADLYAKEELEQLMFNFVRENMG